MIKLGAMYMGGAVRPKEFALAVEKAGFHSLWAGDHILHYVDGIATLGCFAGCTDRIELGTSVIVVPFRPPAVTAKGILTAGWIAGREIIAGFGPGGDVPKEFDVCGANIKERGAYTDEALEVMSLLWRCNEVSFEGRWSSFTNVRMQPADAPKPKIWIGGRSEASLRRAVAYGSGYIPYLVGPEQLARRVARLRKIAETEDRNLDGFTVACATFMIPAKSVDEAVAIGQSNVGFQNVTPERMAAFYILGNRQDRLARVQQYIEAGATHVVLGCAPGRADQLERFVEAGQELIDDLRPNLAALA